MGYDIYIDRCDIRIDPAKHDEALAAVAAAIEDTPYTWRLGKLVPCATLGDFLLDRYHLEAHTEPGFEGQFFFDGEWFRDHNLETIWLALAPFVDSGGEIDFEGEDGEHWRFAFKDGKCYELNSSIVYESPEDVIARTA